MFLAAAPLLGALLLDGLLDGVLIGLLAVPVAAGILSPEERQILLFVGFLVARIEEIS
jgi:hypothetical protein